MSPSSPYSPYDPRSGTHDKPVDPLDFVPDPAYDQLVSSYHNTRRTDWESSLRDRSILPLPNHPDAGCSIPGETGTSPYAIPDLDHRLDIGQHSWSDTFSPSARPFPNIRNVGPYVDLDRPGPSTLPPSIGLPPSAFSSSGTYDIAQSFGKIFISDSALDAEGDDVNNREELAPPPPRSPQRRYSPYGLDRPKRVSSPVKPTSSSAQSSSSSVRSNGRSRPRNPQSDVLPEAFEQALLDSSCVCPVCGFVPANRRAPDLRRHMNTHRGRASHEKWVCCGVPLEKADEYGIEDTSDSYTYKGHEMVGGCLQGFSRRDALIRHLKNDKIECYGIVDLAEKMSEL